jgi:Zn-dependent membrane protease YugP
MSYLFLIITCFIIYWSVLIKRHYTSKQFSSISEEKVFLDIIGKIPIIKKAKFLKDRYDAAKKVIYLYKQDRSIPSIAIAAHEAAHVRQHQTGSIAISLYKYKPYKAVNAIYPFALLFLLPFVNHSIPIFIFFTVFITIKITQLIIEINATATALKHLKRLLLSEEYVKARNLLFITTSSYALTPALYAGLLGLIL